jgi:hypothetical protein
MDALQGEMEDSRTSEVGRKRELAEFAPPQDASSDSEDSVQRSHKRAKQDHAVAGSEHVADEIIINMSSESLAPLPPTEMPQIPSTRQQTIATPPLPTWNKGVRLQSGLRTSFGSRGPVLTRAPAPVHDDEEDNAFRANVGVNPKEDVIADATQSPINSGSSSSLKGVAHGNPAAGPDADDTDNTRPKGKRSRKKKTQVLEPDSSGVRPIKGDTPSLTLEPRSLVGTQLPRALPSGTKRVYENGHGTFELSEILRDSQPLSLEDFKIADFVPHFLATNANRLESLIVKHIKRAFNAYIGLYYGHLRIQALDKARATSTTKLANHLCSSALAKAKQAAKEELQVGESKEPAKVQGETGIALNNSEIGAAVVSRLPAGGALEALSGSDTDANNRDGHEFVPLASPELEREDGEMSSTGDEAFDVTLNDLEIELLQRYFPDVPGSVARPSCLACAKSGHKTYDCPALTCNLCDGNHSVSTCPKKQRCGKCRVRGHHITECPEKLFLSRSEAGGCDLCQSQDHLEIACHLIWRSFDPKPEEIRTVRDIPVSCYVCGASNHYGPECGLHSGKILSGGVTWSKLNLQKYLDPSSSDRAISAGTDYSLPNLPRKGFSIKGKAEDPITLDDSDDEAGFIRPSVKLSSNQSQRGNNSHHIQFAQNLRNGQEPSIGPSSQRALKFPRQARSTFGDGIGLQDSVRYGRERTFSPPPRYGDFRAGFNGNDRYLPQAPSRDNYRPSDEGRHTPYEGKRTMPGNNSFRGGQPGKGRGATARGGSNARGKRRTRGAK